jgi:tRNA (Thr-GGU) A37 N-methylase
MLTYEDVLAAKREIALTKAEIKALTDSPGAVIECVRPKHWRTEKFHNAGTFAVRSWYRMPNPPVNWRVNVEEIKITDCIRLTVRRER